MSNRRPPRALERLATWLLPAWSAEEVAGDLHEEFVAIGTTRGWFRAYVWYACVAVRLAPAAVVRRLSGSVTTSPAEPHRSRGDSVMRSLIVDVHHAVRALRKHPMVTGLVVVTLSLGIAANAAIFQVIDALVLRPFTFEGADRVLMLAETAPDIAYPSETVSPANYLDWRKQADVFEHIAAFDWWDVNIASNDGAERARGFRVTADMFAVLGVQPAIGRTFRVDDETPGNDNKAVLSHDLWQRRFQGDPAVVGRTLLLDAVPHEIVGVTPAGFSFPLGAEIWAPLAFDPKTAARRDSRYLTVIARLAPGRTLPEAEAQMTVIGTRLAAQYPEVNKDRGARALTLTAGMRDQGLGAIVTMWQASAAFVLLIACANIANLLLARGAERQREIAVRSALGASRGRLVRGLLAESVVLSAASVPLALGLAWLAVTVIRGNLPPRLAPFVAGWSTMDIDARSVGFVVVLAAATAVIFGMVPALRASRQTLTEALKEGGRSTTAGRGRQTLRRGLAVAQVALALPLLVLSGICAIGAHRFLAGSQGYDPDGLVIMRSMLPDAKYPDAKARQRFAEDAVAALLLLPGVESAAAANVLPAHGINAMRAIAIDGIPPADPANPPTVQFRAVTPTLLATLRVPILQGRGFSPADTAEAAPVAIVSRSAAARHFGDGEAIGRRIKLGDGPWVTVVGICGDVIHDWFSHRYTPTVYRPFAQAPTGYLALAVRTGGATDAVMLAAPKAIRTVDPAQPVFDMMSARVALHEKTIGLQYVAWIMAVFGVLALVLAVVGVYSLMAFIVAQRTHEIGVRIALGARRADVLKLTVGQAARLTAAGAGVGLLLSVVLSRLLESTLGGALASDGRIAFAFAAVLVGTAIAAGYLPARRAATIDPLVALRD